MESSIWERQSCATEQSLVVLLTDPYLVCIPCIACRVNSLPVKQMVCDRYGDTALVLRVANMMSCYTANGQAQTNRQDPRAYYNGWSSMAKLKNREPPLVIAYGNPLKCKLTPEVHTSRL
jgi:molybdopterin/thiamine biosynthesis adenylyltransferase